MSDKFKDIYRIPTARAPWWNYRNNATYFVTICTRSRECFFGDIKDDVMHLSEIGMIAQSFWNEIPEHMPFVRLHAMIVMPNHIHGIVETLHVETLHVETLHVKTLHVKTLHATSLHMSSISPKRGSLGSIIRSYKSAVTYNARTIDTQFGWHARYYDRIIKDDQAYQKIEEYIKNNPSSWKDDDFCTDGM